MDWIRRKIDIFGGLSPEPPPLFLFLMFSGWISGSRCRGNVKMPNDPPCHQMATILLMAMRVRQEWFFRHPGAV